MDRQTAIQQFRQLLQAWGSKPPTYVDSLGSIALAYGMERMAGEDRIEWESAKLELLGSRTEGSMPADIVAAVNFGEKDLYLGEEDDNRILVQYLASTDNDVEKAYEKVGRNSKLKAKYNEFFAKKRDPDLHDAILERGIFQMLDGRDQLGRRIFLIRLKNLSYGDFEINELVQMPDLFLNLALDEEETQKSGIAFIMDMDGMSWGLLRYLSTQAVKVAAAKAENIPLRHMQIHVVNAGFIVTTGVNMVFPFLSQRLKDLIFFHDDYESLHEHVSPSALPEDYDGDKPPVDSARLISEFLDPRNDRLTELLSYGYINNKEEGENKHEDNGEDSEYEESE